MSDETYQYVADRGITQETMEFFNVKTKVSPDGEPTDKIYEYGNGAVVFRTPDKKFPSKGKINEAGLWAKEHFPPGCAASITITEGREDAMSVYQMLGRKAPAVSVQSATSAVRDCRIDRDYVNSFSRIYLCFDTDLPGQKAAKEVAELFDFNKVFVINLGEFKDANAMLQAGRQSDFFRLWHNTKRIQPEDIHSSLGDFKEIFHADDGGPGYEYPFGVLQGPTGGIRRGEVTLITARRGVGKTTVIHQIEHHILKKYPDEIIGVIHLEEKKKTSLKALASLELGYPCHLPGTTVPDDVAWAAFETLVKTDDRFHLYSHFGSNDPNVILDRIRYMVGVLGCSVVILDHITMVVSGLMTDDSVKALDYISTRLAMMAVELNFAMVIVSHINKEGGTKGSANIADTASTWIHLDRDPLAESDFLKRLTTVSLFKNRTMSITGEVGKLLFNPVTFALADLKDKDLPA